MQIYVTEFDKITAFLMKARKGNFSDSDWREWGEIYKKALIRYKKSNRKTANRIREKRAQNKNYGRGHSNYAAKKDAARKLAIDWKNAAATRAHSWKWCAEWAARFEKIGRKYGLLREFKNNGIL